MDINEILDRTKFFALKIIVLCKYLQDDLGENILSSQLLRCGTTLGARVREAVRGQPRADFTSKMNDAITDADECAYWMELLYGTDYLSKEQFMPIYEECREIISLLLSVTKNQMEIKKKHEFFRLQ